MTLAEFIAESQDQLERFEEYWEEMNTEDDEEFAIDMTRTQWLKKFSSWMAEEEAEGSDVADDEA